MPLISILIKQNANQKIYMILFCKCTLEIQTQIENTAFYTLQEEH